MHKLGSKNYICSSMDSVSGENGGLKLVYPGGFVEIYKNPITAAEVMKRNPRHCVTRPDVFKFPWIVVRPESVLKPGRVFYVVPYHTIYRLLRSKDFSHRQKVTSWTDATLDNQLEELKSRREQDINNEISVDRSHFHRLVKRGNNRELHSSTACITIGDEKYENKFCRQQLVELKTLKDCSYEAPNQSQQQQGIKQRPNKEVYNLYVDANYVVQSLLPRYEERVKLKSCLKKLNNKIPKSRGFKVRFALDHGHGHEDDI